MSALVSVGTYTGVRVSSVFSSIQRINLGFVPELVIVIPRDSTPVSWLNNSAWHGRSQYFHSAASGYVIRPLMGRGHEPFTGKGFGVTGAANAHGTVYDYIAIADNGEGMMSATSWIGNADTGRVIDWLDAAPDAVMVKRDASRPSVWRINGASGVNAWLDYQAGNSEVITAMSADGITVTSDIRVNENVPAALGEGIEGIAFFNTDHCRVVTYTGDGTSSQAVALGIEADACLVMDLVNDATGSTQRASWVTDSMSANNSKPVDATALDTTGKIQGMSGTSLTVGSAFNVSGRAYAVIAFKRATGTQTVETVKVRTGAKTLQLDSGNGFAQLPDNSLGGTYSYMFYGRIRGPGETLSDQYFPIVSFGEGTDQVPAASAGDYNGGMYLDNQDPDGNGWQGSVLRVIHSQFTRSSRTSATLNSYDRNTGYQVQLGRDVLIHVTKSAAGHDRYYIDGKLIKDYRLTAAIAALETPALDIGGTGSAKPTWVGTYSNDASAKSRRAPNQIHRVAWWDSTELTPAQVLSHARHVKFREGYSGPAPSQDINFESGIPSGVTVTNGSLVDRVDTTDWDDEPATKHISGSGVNVTNYTASGAIPGAGTYVVGVMTCEDGGDYSNINALTAVGDAVTLGDALYTGETTAGGRHFRAQYFLVTASGAGDVVVGFDKTTLFASVSVWACETPSASASGAINSAGTATSVVTDISSLSGRNLLCVIGHVNGAIPNTNVSSLARSAAIHDFALVGSSSRVLAGEGWTGGQANASVQQTYTNTCNGIATAVLALPQAKVQTLQFVGAGGDRTHISPMPVGMLIP